MNWLVRKTIGGIKCLKEHGFKYTIRHFFEKVVNKAAQAPEIINIINKPFVYLADKLQMHLIEIITVSVGNKSNSRHVYFMYIFGKQVYPRKRSMKTSPWIDPTRPPMYLKVNRMSYYAALCVQQWVDVAYSMRAEYYIVCDNKQLEYHLLRNVIFPDENIRFMTSMRKRLGHISRTLADGQWEKAACAHLTPFYHAKDMGKSKFWNIDADDTMFCLQNNRIARVLEMVQTTADSNEYSSLSLDMWRSVSHGRHWSCGVMYVNDNVDFCHFFNENKDFSWTEVIKGVLNIDLYFNYLLREKNVKIDSFYVDNAYFIHYGDFLNAPRMLAGVYVWNNGKLTFPICKYIHETRGVFDIPGCIKIDIGATKKEGIDFLNHNLSRVK